MPVSRETEELLRIFSEAEGPGFLEMTPNEAREAYVQLAVMQGEPVQVASVEDVLVPGLAGDIPIRIYKSNLEIDLPVFIYYHGGGWELGNLETHDPLCRQLALQSNCAVLAVDYRLAPENKFPASADDAYEVVKWVAEEGGSLGLDGSRIAVGGDSSGGNLAAVVSIMARDRGNSPLVAQILIYPVTDYCFDTTSYQEHGSGYILTTELMQNFWDLYLSKPSDGDNPLASPLRANDLSGLPRALVLTAECDVLRDEGEAYGGRLRAAGVETTVHRYNNMMHGFIQFGSMIPEAHTAISEIAAELKAAFNHNQ